MQIFVKVLPAYIGFVTHKNTRATNGLTLFVLLLNFVALGLLIAFYESLMEVCIYAFNWVSDAQLIMWFERGLTSLGCF